MANDSQQTSVFNGSMEEFIRNLNWTEFNFGSHDEIPASEKTFKICLYVVVIVAATVGNFFLLLVILKTKSLRTKFNFFVLNLAIVDLLVPGTCMWLHLVSYLNQGQWTMGAFFCRIKTFVQVMAVTVSAFTLTITVIDRYFAANYPHLLKFTQGYQVVIIIFIWISGTLVSLPWLLYTKLTIIDLIGFHQSSCKAHFPSLETRKAYTMSFCVIGYILPVTVMFVLVAKTMTKTIKIREPSLPVAQVNDEIKRKALRLLLTVLIVFFLCWTPQQMLLLWDVYRDRSAKAKLPKGINTYVYYAYFVAFSSTGVYPVIYIMFNKSFRHAVKHIFTVTRVQSDPTVIGPAPEDEQVIVNGTELNAISTGALSSIAS